MLKTEKRLAELEPGTRLIVLATDPIAKIDISLFCAQNGHVCEVATDGDVFRFVVTRKAN